MALNATQSKNKGNAPSANREPLQGTYPARLVGVVDMGLQPQRPFEGKEKAPAYDFTLVYEFVDEFLKDENGVEDKSKPRWLSEQMPLYSLEAEKAKSTTRYKAFDPTGSRNGNWPDLLDLPVMVTVVHNPGKGKNVGKVYEKLANVVAMRAKDAAKCPPLVNEPFVFDLDSPDVAVFNQLPKFMQERIRGNLEFKGSKLEAMLGDKAEPVATAVEGKFEPDADMDDEIPF